MPTPNDVIGMETLADFVAALGEISDGKWENWDDAPAIWSVTIVRVADKVWRFDLSPDGHWWVNPLENADALPVLYSNEPAILLGWCDDGVAAAEGKLLSQFAELVGAKATASREVMVSFIRARGWIGGMPIQIRSTLGCDWDDNDKLVWKKDKEFGLRWDAMCLGERVDGHLFPVATLSFGNAASSVSDAFRDAISYVRGWVATQDHGKRALYMQVLDEIGDKADTSEFRDVEARYGAMAESPLPLLGSPDANHIREILDLEWPWATRLNAAACRTLALTRHLGKKHFYCRPLLLVGPAGVGKTRWARRLAELAGVAFHCQSAATGNDPYAISGLSRTWKGAGPSVVARAMRDRWSANPLICLDEIDKATGSREHGSIQDVLLPMLERSSAQRLYDTYLCGNIDARWVNWVMTANGLAEFSEPFLDRCKTLAFPSPRPQDFEAILTTARTDIALQWECADNDLPALSDCSTKALRRLFLETLTVRPLVNAFQDALCATADGEDWTGPDDMEVTNGRSSIGFLANRSH